MKATADMDTKAIMAGTVEVMAKATMETMADIREVMAAAMGIPEMTTATATMTATQIQAIRAREAAITARATLVMAAVGTNKP